MIVDTRAQKNELKRERAELMAHFHHLNLNLEEVWQASDDPARDVKLLSDLRDWVYAYWAYEDRKTMQRHGYDYPPIQPGMGPEDDWLRFERWVKGQPLTWNLREEVGRTPPAEGLPDNAVKEHWAYLVALLDHKGVAVGFPPHIPLRERYAYLRSMLIIEEFDLVAPGSITHLFGNEEWYEDEESEWEEMEEEV